MRLHLRALALVVALLLGGLARPTEAVGEGAVMAKYYAWFDQSTWASGKPSDLPAQPYLSSDRAAIERQVDQARAAGIDGFALNWWGPDNPTDTNLQTLLEVAKTRNFKVTVDVDLNSPFWENEGDVANALVYLRRYYAHPAWYRYDGWPVISFYGIRKYPVATWSSIRSIAARSEERYGWAGWSDGLPLAHGPWSNHA